MKKVLQKIAERLLNKAIKTMNRNNFLIIWGVAHSDTVAGKQSPDGRHKEPVWSKEQCNKMHELCKMNDIDSVVLQPKSDDLNGRIDFVNRCDLAAKGYKKALLISLHNNAAGMGDKWMDAHGWCLYTCRGETMSDVFAKDIFDRVMAHFPDEPVRYNNEIQPDFEENFTVLMGQNYNAVLIEWFFQDDVHDLARIENSDIASGLRLCLFNFVKEQSVKKW